MEMDIYERESYVHSTSNLVMLKAFYDKGVDVTKLGINDYFVDLYGYSMDNSVDILHSCLKSLFDDCLLLDNEELQSESNYAEILTDGMPEYALFISYSKIDDLFISKYVPKLVEIIKNHQSFSYTEAEIIVSEKTKELCVLVWFPGQLHEIALALIKVYEEVEKLHQILEGEISNGISDNHNG